MNTSVGTYLGPFVIAALMAGGLTYSIKMIAQKFGWVDYPGPRKIHKTPIPRLGGVAIVLTFLILVFAYSLASHRLEFSSFKILFLEKRLFGVILGSLILLGAGIYDDIKGLTASKKLFWQILSALTVVAFGLTIPYVRLPFGLHLDLDSWIIPVNLFGHGFSFMVWGDLLTVFWILLAINTINFLDGLDGLASGVAIIASISLFFLSLSLGQFASALLCLILAGSISGFLPWNFNPAKIFLGDSGSMFIGFMLGVLAIISGGKLATAFLILGIPILDVVWVVIRRIISKKSPFVADKLHMHHRLLAIGFSQRQTAIALYIISAIFGVVAIYSTTDVKYQAVVWLLALMFILITSLIVLEYRRRKKMEISENVKKIEGKENV